MPKKKPPNKHSKKNGSLFVTLSQLVDLFYVSRFNRDEMHSLYEDEDMDDSNKHRIYNKGDVKELLAIFVSFFEWVINEKNISKIYLTKDMYLVRESVLPRVKYATAYDEKYAFDNCKAGGYYITYGKYAWKLILEGEAFNKMKNLWLNDPEYLKIRESLIPIMEEKNSARARNNDQSPQ